MNMDRLTEKKNGFVGYKDCFRDCKHPNNGCDCRNVRVALHRLAAYEDAEEQGRLVVLPCKVGDTVWKIRAVFSYYSKPMEDRVGRIIISDKEILVCCTSGVKFSADSVGKTVFLTREEAEAALAGKDGELEVEQDG